MNYNNDNNNNNKKNHNNKSNNSRYSAELNKEKQHIRTADNKIKWSGISDNNKKSITTASSVKYIIQYNNYKN